MRGGSAQRYRLWQNSHVDFECSREGIIHWIFPSQTRDLCEILVRGRWGTGMRTAWLGWVVLVSAAVVAGTPHSFADEIAPVGEYKEGLALGSWMLYPSVFLGAVYDSNLAQAPQGTPTENAFGVRAVPRLIGTYDGGIYKTTVYGVVDGDFYHDSASNSNFFDANTLSVSAGFAEAYQPMRDLLFNVYGNYTRERDIFNSALNFNNGAIGPAGTPTSNIPLIINPFGTVPSVNPIPFNQFTGGASGTYHPAQPSQLSPRPLFIFCMTSHRTMCLHRFRPHSMVQTFG